MHLFSLIASDLVFTRECLKAGVFVSLLSVWVLVALFFYLNRYTRRRYFTIWTGAWLFYGLWLTLSFGLQNNRHQPPAMMFQQWCIGVAAILLLWGSLLFVGERVRVALLAWFAVFLFVWSYFGAYQLGRALELEVPVFSLIAIASLTTAASFFRYRRKHPYVGATLLSLGFLLWAGYMLSYPFLESSDDFTSVALFISAGLQLLLAVSMIILVLEEARENHHEALEQVRSREEERNALQSRVASTEQRYQRLFDQASEAIIITEAMDFRILELNQAAERMLGIPRAEANRHCLTTFCQFKKADRPTPQSSVEWFHTLCRQRPLSLVHKNGAIAQVELNGTLVDFEGRAAYQFCLLELTERARLEQQLRQAEKLSAIGQMISGVAHELNNPLSVIKGYLELVLGHHDLGPQTRVDLEKAAIEGNRAAKLVSNFLSFAREQPVHRELVDLNQLSRQLVELRRVEMLVAKTEVVLELAPDLPMVSADPDQIHQLVVNLMNNAVQAMVQLPQPGRLRIKTTCFGRMARLMVEDNGPGVPSELLDKIFEPFFTTKEVGAGTGLGLSIAHSLMTEHGGRIFYETSHLGGAAFVLEFPPAPANGHRVKEESTTAFIVKPHAPEPLRTGKILVLDDEKAIAEMLGEMLGILGYTPTICHMPAQALELIEAQDFDLVISDFRMPGINGRQFYSFAMEKKPALASRIIFLTGDVVNEETQDFLKSIGNPHIAKPFSLESVKGVVADAVTCGSPHEVVPAAC